MSMRECHGDRGVCMCLLNTEKYYDNIMVYHLLHWARSEILNRVGYTVIED